MSTVVSRSLESQLVPDVHAYPGHIACAARLTAGCAYIPSDRLAAGYPVGVPGPSTQSELVVPVTDPTCCLLMAVLDIDSDTPAAFTEVDQKCLEELCSKLGQQFSGSYIAAKAGWQSGPRPTCSPPAS
ncbi:hypothetical protein V8C86DRAFT_2434446 [Haematococcus lacustris]